MWRLLNVHWTDRDNFKAIVLSSQRGEIRNAIPFRSGNKSIILTSVQYVKLCSFNAAHQKIKKNKSKSKHQNRQRQVSGLFMSKVSSYEILIQFVECRIDVYRGSSHVKCQLQRILFSEQWTVNIEQCLHRHDVRGHTQNFHRENISSNSSNKCAWIPTDDKTVMEWSE